MTGTLRASARSSSSPSRQPCEAGRFEQRVRACRAQHLLPRGADERGGTAVEDRFRRRDDDDDVGANECRMNAQGNASCAADLDEVLTLDVVHLDVAVEPAGELRRHERLEPLAACTACEPACDEQRLIAGRNAQALELGDCGRDRSMTRVTFGARKR